MVFVRACVRACVRVGGHLSRGVAHVYLWRDWLESWAVLLRAPEAHCTERQAATVPVRLQPRHEKQEHQCR